MADHVSGLVERLRQRNPELRGALSSAWNSTEPQHRLLIRNSIRQTLGLNGSKFDHLSDLQQRPTVAGWSISVSHCPRAGGWLALRDPAKLGFDIELRERIQSRLVNRISTEGELNRCPYPGLLWVAKEAYYKALAPHQPKTVTELYIDSWCSLGDEEYSFAGRNGFRSGQGFVSSAEGLLVSVCIV